MFEKEEREVSQSNGESEVVCGMRWMMWE